MNRNRSNGHSKTIIQFWLPLWVMMCTSYSFPISMLQHHRWKAETYDWYTKTPVRYAPLYAQKQSNSYCKSGPSDIQYILRQYGFIQRVITLDNIYEQQLPCELYQNGKWKLGLLVGVQTINDDNKAPLLDVHVLGDDWEEKVVDIGQITSIWYDFHQTYSIPAANLKDVLKSAYQSSQTSLQNNIFPVEKAMQNLYNNRISNRQKKANIITKKQIPKIASMSSNPSHMEELLRNLVKVGEDRVSRLVDASFASDYLYKDFSVGDEGIKRRMVAATVLSEDAITGGRFKRRSCQFVETVHSNDGAQLVTLMNGGWIAVDPSVKSGTEGRKFATLADVSSTSNQLSGSSSSRVFTAADERVAQRLECLAMGDVWKDDSYDGDEQRLELDVREALIGMNLPLTPDGAKIALFKIGRWSKSDSTKNSRIEPWSAEVLTSARSLANYEKRRRISLAKTCFTKNKSHLEGRVNLTALPCVCVDAQRATFRDDSIGLRMRSSTGRKVNKGASKWEILIHIADVSDLYFSDDKTNENVVIPQMNDLDLELLRQAAERRGQSRYDFPLGPLHLLPPVALEALALSTNQNKVPNRCVTLWAYIDERDGKLLEAGLERTIISSPIAISFSEATKLLESTFDDVPKDLSNAKAILSAAERHLSRWTSRHKQRNTAAQKRESRLATREIITAATNGPSSRDDGAANSFQRSRGHRIVDSALDLYAFALGTLMKRAKQPIPRAAGSGADRGGRLGTAPLRRYIDGLAQRQAISVLCNYGIPLTIDECRLASNKATEAGNEIKNLRSNGQRKPSSRKLSNHISALHKLNNHLISTSGINNKRRVKAISTGRNNEVVIVGVGAMARLKGVASLEGGKTMVVEVTNIDPEKGILDVKLLS